MLAWYFHKHEATLRMRDFAVAALLLAVPVLLIARQPDLGTALLVAAAGFYVIFLAGLSLAGHRRPGASPALREPAFRSGGMLHDYQRRRILTLLDPTQDPLGAGYHTIQSTIAVGSGGLAGKGWLQRHADAPRVHPGALTPTSSSPCSPRNSACSATSCCSSLYLLLIGARPDDRRQRADVLRAPAGRRRSR